jgi:hypothetical protein
MPKKPNILVCSYFTTAASMFALELKQHVAGQLPENVNATNVHSIDYVTMHFSYM